jgi:mersacidin/lichenicidin family type 2 lantibiotic
MSNIDIARALRDKAYFDSLTPEEQGHVLAQNPSGEVDLKDEDLIVASGGVAAASGSGSGSGSGNGDIIIGCDCSCNCNC